MSKGHVKWMAGYQEASGRNLQSLSKRVSQSAVATQDPVKCNESKSMKYLTVKEQEESWEAILYRLIKE